MSGRRRSGRGLAAGLQVISGAIATDSERRYKESQERRDFDRRVQEAGIKIGLETGQIEPQFSEGQLTGFGAPATSPMNMLGLLQGQGQDGTSPYQFKPKFDKFGRPTGFDTDILTPEQQIQQEMLGASRQLQQAQEQAGPVLGQLEQSQPMPFGVSERMLDARPEAIGRATEMVSHPIQQARDRLASLQQTNDALTPGAALSNTKLAQEVEIRSKKMQLDQQRQTNESEFIKESARDTLKTIEEVERGMNYFGLTGPLPSVPGTSRALWEANVNKLLSGKIIQLMSEMKRVSRTGATGFGQLSQRELAVLQEASTALKRNLSPRDAQPILDTMKEKLRRIAQDEMDGQGGGGAGDDPLGLR